MGEAKRRGTFEERKAMAIAKRKKEEHEALVARINNPKPPKHRRPSKQALLACAVALMFLKN